MTAPKFLVRSAAPTLAGTSTTTLSEIRDYQEQIATTPAETLEDAMVQPGRCRHSSITEKTMDRLLASALAAIEATATAKSVQPHYAQMGPIGADRSTIGRKRLPVRVI